MKIWVVWFENSFPKIIDLNEINKIIDYKSVTEDWKQFFLLPEASNGSEILCQKILKAGLEVLKLTSKINRKVTILNYDLDSISAFKWGKPY